MNTGIMTDKDCLESVKKYLPEAKKELVRLLSAANADTTRPSTTISCALHRWLPWAIERIEKLEEGK